MKETTITRHRAPKSVKIEGDQLKAFKSKLASFPTQEDFLLYCAQVGQPLRADIIKKIKEGSTVSWQTQQRVAQITGVKAALGYDVFD